MNRTKVLLLFGGESSEHDISVASTKNVREAMNEERYEITLCFIDRQGKWWIVNEISSHVSEGAIEIFPSLGHKAFIANGQPLEFDVILPILHGANGEDGSVQGLAQLMHLPIVGCDMTSSAIGMNKFAAKQIAIADGIPVVQFEIHRADEGDVSYEEVSARLGDTLFVKPASSGSSVGVSKVRNPEEFDRALIEAHKHDALVLIERAIEGRELEVAILGNYPNTKASTVGEIKPDGDFYSYEAKYDDESMTEVVVPADVPVEVSKIIQETALRVFELFGCSGLSRVDFFLDENGQVLFNEINTFPGFTNISMYPKMWQHDSITYSELIETLIELALNRSTAPHLEK